MTHIADLPGFPLEDLLGGTAPLGAYHPSEGALQQSLLQALLAAAVDGQATDPERAPRGGLGLRGLAGIPTLREEADAAPEELDPEAARSSALRAAVARLAPPDGRAVIRGLGAGALAPRRVTTTTASPFLARFLRVLRP